jgi:hypothetical protein
MVGNNVRALLVVPYTPSGSTVFVLNQLCCLASRRYTVSLYNQGVLNKGLESFEQLLLESGESLVACMLRCLLLGAL